MNNNATLADIDEVRASEIAQEIDPSAPYRSSPESDDLDESNRRWRGLPPREPLSLRYIPRQTYDRIVSTLTPEQLTALRSLEASSAPGTGDWLLTQYTARPWRRTLQTHLRRPSAPEHPTPRAATLPKLDQHGKAVWRLLRSLNAQSRCIRDDEDALAYRKAVYSTSEAIISAINALESAVSVASSLRTKRAALQTLRKIAQHLYSSGGDDEARTASRKMGTDARLVEVLCLVATRLTGEDRRALTKVDEGFLREFTGLKRRRGFMRGYEMFLELLRGRDYVSPSWVRLQVLQEGDLRAEERVWSECVRHDEAIGL